MRCHICDKALSDKEVIWNTDLNGYEPCSVCLTAAMEAAYSEGFHRPDEDRFEELGDDVADSDVETLDNDAFRSSVDQYQFMFNDDEPAYD